MLQNGNTEAQNSIPQLELAKVTSWKCPCSCASINFKIGEHPEAPPGVNILGDFTVGDKNKCTVYLFFHPEGTQWH
ncbi:MAG: hypothetical protein NMNS02_18520 [Nitrosomonas sp.]|nr:MAG: hypothetical protein NMNS02_18520 [Nitrosomonas sp.]